MKSSSSNVGDIIVLTNLEMKELRKKIIFLHFKLELGPTNRTSMMSLKKMLDRDLTLLNKK